MLAFISFAVLVQFIYMYYHQGWKSDHKRWMSLSHDVYGINHDINRGQRFS